jgi:hypothetical protein
LISLGLESQLVAAGAVEGEIESRFKIAAFLAEGQFLDVADAFAEVTGAGGAGSGPEGGDAFGGGFLQAALEGVGVRPAAERGEFGVGDGLGPGALVDVAAEVFGEFAEEAAGDGLGLSGGVDFEAELGGGGGCGGEGEEEEAAGHLEGECSRGGGSIEQRRVIIYSGLIFLDLRRAIAYFGYVS